MTDAQRIAPVLAAIETARHELELADAPEGHALDDAMVRAAEHLDAALGALNAALVADAMEHAA